MEKRFYWLYVTVFINILAFGMVFPILPLFAKSFEATSFQVGLLTAVFSLSQFLFAPFLGKVSDRYGRKPALMFSIAMTSLALFIISFAHGLTMVFVGMFLQGLGSAGVLPGALAYIADITSGHNRSKYISRVTGTFALGFMIGPAIGGIIGNTSLSEPFLYAGIVSIVNFLVIALFLKETHHERDEKLAIKQGLVNIKPIIRALRGEMGVLLFTLFAWSFYIANFSLTIPFFTLDNFDFGPTQNGLFFSFVGLIAGITQWFLLPLIEKKIGDMRVIYYGFILLVVGQLLAPLALTPILFFAIFTFTVFGSALARPSINALISKKTVEGQGATMGIAFSVESLGRITGPILLGIVLTEFNSSLPFTVTAIVLIAAMLLFRNVEMKKQG